MSRSDADVVRHFMTTTRRLDELMKEMEQLQTYITTNIPKAGISLFMTMNLLQGEIAGTTMIENLDEYPVMQKTCGRCGCPVNEDGECEGFTDRSIVTCAGPGDDKIELPELTPDGFFWEGPHPRDRSWLRGTVLELSGDMTVLESDQEDQDG